MKNHCIMLLLLHEGLYPAMSIGTFAISISDPSGSGSSFQHQTVGILTTKAEMLLDGVHGESLSSDACKMLQSVLIDNEHLCLQ